MTTEEKAALVKRAETVELGAHADLQRLRDSGAALFDQLKLATDTWAKAATTLARLSPLDTRDAAPVADVRTLALVASHLVPLGLAAADTPLEEHARLAADIVRRATQPQPGEQP